MFANMGRRLGIVGLLLPALLLLGPLYLYPLAQIVVLSFSTPGWTTSHYVALFSDRFLMRVFLQTLRLALSVTVLCVVIGYPIAYAMRISSERAQRIMAILIVMPLWTSILVRSFTWMVILGRNGIVNGALETVGVIDAPLKLVYNSVGVYVGMMHVMLPFMILPLYSVLRRIDMRLVFAAESLGSTAITAFFWIVLPLSMPGVLAGALLVFMSSVGLFVIPALLGGLSDITYVMAIEKQVDELNNWELAAAMSMLLLFVTGLLTLLYEQALALEAPVNPIGRIMRAIFQRGPVVAMVWLSRLSPKRGGMMRAGRAGVTASHHRLVQGFSWAIIFCLVTPLLVIFPLALSNEPYLHFPPTSLSLRWFTNYFSRSDWIAPTITSLEVGFVTTLGAIVVGIPSSYAIVRGRFPGKGFIAALLISPIVVPVMILAISLYALYARLHLIGTVGGLVLAHLILALPYVVLIVSGALRSTDESLELVALTLGAGRVRAFMKVTLPLLRPAVLSAAFFAFLASFDDLVLALFLSGTSAKTLPLRMWEGIRFEIDPTTAAVSALLIVLSVGLMLISEWTRRGRGDKAGVAHALGRP